MKRLLTVAEVAEVLSVSTDFVYSHGDLLGLVKVAGANRYRPEAIERLVAEPTPAAAKAVRRHPRVTAPVDLLPIRGPRG
jgi:hypothetical protein